MIIMKVFVLIAFFTLSNSKTSLMPNLHLGEYRTIYEKIYPCESKRLIQSNIYLSKNTLSLTEVKGNYTFLVPLDDTLTGTYSTTGLDLKELSDHNFPKVYFYGKYKATIKIKNVGNEVIGCSVMEISLIRPWETPT
ncbi:uncharacterized protein LOC113557823 [Rhopalosiphum maidis]|uniref:uncharacterized protein LOC113557823 n=1 Tax=Rhopalosiphum maidis TaxID=43146 RepID=UPI000EFFEAC0|nr:uncharacterized protein LOC113557823 [Rhopalosiphum maidis]